MVAPSDASWSVACPTERESMKAPPSTHRPRITAAMMV
jgi:hypothetical protein